MSWTAAEHSYNGTLANVYRTQFSYGLCVCGIIDPHMAHWGRVFHRIARANVPIWLLWGNDGDRMCVDPIMCFVYYPPAYALDIAKSHYIVDAPKHALDTLVFDCVSEHATKSTKSCSPLTIPSASIESYRETGWDITSSKADPGYIPDEYSPEDSTQDIDDTEEYSEIHSPSSSQLSPPITSSARVFAQMMVYLRICHGYSINCIATSLLHVDLYGSDALAEDLDKPFLYLLYKDTTTLSLSTMLGVTSWWNVMANIPNNVTSLLSEWDIHVDSDILSCQLLFSVIY